jgi:hypothetical protein
MPWIIGAFVVLGFIPAVCSIGCWHDKVPVL